MGAGGGAAGFAPGTLLMAGTLTVLTSAQGLLTSASKSGGGYAYDFATVPFLAELVKLGISYGLLERQRAADPGSIRCTRDARTVALFIVPSIIYMFHNNVQVGAAAGCCRWVLAWAHGCWPAGCMMGAGWVLASWVLLLSDERRPAERLPAAIGTAAQRFPAAPLSLLEQFFFLKFVDPATYQILGNLKIVTTGLLLRVALHRHLSRLQWMALLLLMAGAATSQIATDCSKGGAGGGALSAPFMVRCAGGPCAGLGTAAFAAAALAG